MSKALEKPEVLSVIENGRSATHKVQTEVWNNVFLTKGWLNISPYLYFKNGLDANINLLFNKPQFSQYMGMEPIRIVQYGDSLTSELVNAGNVRYIISLSPLTQSNFIKLIHTITPPLLSLPSYFVYENTQVLDRFRFVSDYQVESSIPSIITLFQENKVPLQTKVVLEEDPKVTLQNLEKSDIMIIKDEDQEIILKTYTDKPALLVVADSYYPGWHASINGQETPILAANINQRAILVPEGENQIKLKYIPELFYKGIKICLATTTLLVVGLFFPAFRHSLKVYFKKN